MSAELGLRKPSIAVYVQTSDRWDAEKKLCCQFTQAKESTDPCNQNFMEQLELLVRSAASRCARPDPNNRGNEHIHSKKSPLQCLHQ